MPRIPRKNPYFAPPAEKVRISTQVYYNGGYCLTFLSRIPGLQERSRAETSPGWMEPHGTMRTGPQVRNKSAFLIMNCLLLGEPHKGSRPCVFFGKDLDDPGKWYDGVCEWSRWTFDCVCKNIDTYVT